MLKLLPFLIACGLSAQVTSQICFVTDKTKPAQMACQDLKPALRGSLAAFIASTPTSTYTGIADLILSNLRDGLFQSVLSQFPPPAVATALANRDADQATLDAAKATIISKPIVVADP